MHVVFCISSALFGSNMTCFGGSAFMLPFTSTMPGPQSPRVPSVRSVTEGSSPSAIEICQCLPFTERHSRCGLRSGLSPAAPVTRSSGSSEAWSRTTIAPRAVTPRVKQAATSTRKDTLRGMVGSDLGEVKKTA